mgnify:CR=1 FL=1
MTPEADALLAAWAQVSSPVAADFLRQRLGSPRADQVERVKNLLDCLAHRSPQQALRYARDLVAFADAGEDPAARVVARLALGNALLWSEQLEEAHRAYESARKLAELAGLALLAARCGVGQLGVLFRQGRYREALALAEAIEPVLSQDPSTSLYAARVRAQRATVLQYLGETEAALRAYAAASCCFRALGSTAALDLAVAQHNAGSLLAQLGRHAEAARVLEEARRCAQAAGSPLLAARAAAALARVDLAQGRYAHALQVFDEVASCYRQAGVPAAAATYLLFALECRLYLGEAERVAREGFRVARELEQAAFAAEACRARYLSALAHRQRGDLHAAATLLYLAHEGLRQLGREAWRAAAACELAVVRLREQDAAAALALAQDAASVWAQVGSPTGLGRALLVRSDALARCAELAAAAQDAREALRVGHRHHLAWLCVASHRRLSLLRPERRGAHLLRGVRWADRMLAWLPADLRAGLYAELADLYQHAVLYLSKRERWLETWRVVQSAKSRSLAWLLASHGLRLRAQTADSELVRQLDVLLNAYRHRLLGELQDAPAREEVDTPELEARIRDLVWRIQMHHPAFRSQSLMVVRTMRPELPYLPPDTGLLEYFVAGGHVLAFVGRADRTLSGLRVCGAQQVARAAALWGAGLRAFAASQLQPVQALRQARKVLRDLYTLLIRPLERELRAFRKLVVAPSGLLHALPFHAFADGDACVWDRWEVSYVPAGSLLPLLAHPTAGGPPVCVADSLRGRLRGAVREARWVAERLGARLWEHPTPQEFLEAVRGAGVVHVAAHCRFRTDAPLLSAVHLTAGPVTAADVLASDAGCEVVVLSGCETASPRVLPGDELVGFPRAWFHAGARAVVVSLWPVQDASTVELMQHFYDSLCAAVPLPEALRRAGLELRARWEHPWHWAGFVLMGDPSWKPPRAPCLPRSVNGGG